MTTQQSRRSFLQKSVVAGAGLSLIEPCFTTGNEKEIRNETGTGDLPVG